MGHRGGSILGHSSSAVLLAYRFLGSPVLRTLSMAPARAQVQVQMKVQVGYGRIFFSAVFCCCLFFGLFTKHRVAHIRRLTSRTFADSQKAHTHTHTHTHTERAFSTRLALTLVREQGLRLHLHVTRVVNALLSEQVGVGVA